MKVITLFFVFLISIIYVHSACDITCPPKIDNILNILLFSKTSGDFYHDVVNRFGGKECTVEKDLRLTIEAGGHVLRYTKSGGCLTPAMLDCFDVAVFFTSRDIREDSLDGNEPLSQANLDYFMQWIRGGKGFVGLHLASGTLQTYPPYINMIGGNFRGHGSKLVASQFKSFIENDTLAEIVSHIPDTWTMFEEYYDYSYEATDRTELFHLSYDRSGLDLGYSYPNRNWSSIWVRDEGKGRVFYVGIGHVADTWDHNTDFKRMLFKAILYTGNKNITDINPSLLSSSHSNTHKFSSVKSSIFSSHGLASAFKVNSILSLLTLVVVFLFIRV